jgi:phospholipid N-methyltransferase
VLTNGLVKLLSANAKLLAFETNSALAKILGDEYHDRRVQIHCTSAERLDEVCRAQCIKADVVVSGVPFRFLGQRRSLKIIRAAYRALQPSGLCIVYQTFLPPLFPERDIRAMLERYFVIAKRIVVLQNLPPLQVFICRPRSLRAAAYE